MNDVIVQFAVLWGEKIAFPLGRKESELVEDMKRYDSEELLSILTEWAREFTEKGYECEDTVEFFGEKLCELIYE